jgi:acyl carrier protein
MRVYTKAEMHDKAAFKELTSGENKLTDTGIDSFDFIMLYMKLGEEFGIDNKHFKDKLPEGDPTIDVLINFIEENASSVAIS